MNAADFDFVRKIVRDGAAISLDDSKQYLVQSRLEPLAAKVCGGSVDELLRRLRGAPHGELHTKVIEAMTTNETYFFRDNSPFEALRKVVLPVLLKRAESTKALTIWSAASSSGQEAYSIAMLLDTYFPALAGWSVQIVGTDISSAMVRRAQDGIFTQLEVNRGLPAPMLVKYFERDRLEWKLKEPIRRRVTFRQMNLLDARYDLPRLDVVFLRNVLIYFEKPVKEAIVSRIHKLLRPDGAVFLGAGETMFNIDDRFTAVQAEKTLYYRPKA
jgi:chemotaxis protein methyltransferase CheR